jgi:uncharacterized protein YukE
MDPVVLRGIAERMRAQAAQLDDVLSTVQRSVDEAITLWDGDDAHGFNAWWNSHYRPALNAANQSLVGAAAAIERNVNEQERASGLSSGGGSGAASGLGAMTPEELLQLIQNGLLNPSALTLSALSDLNALGFFDDLARLGPAGASGDLWHKLNSALQFDAIKVDPITGFVQGLKSPAGAFTLLSMGIDAVGLGQALGSSNEPEAWKHVLSLSSNFIPVPGAGLAWAGGTYIGEQIYSFTDAHVYDVEGATYSFGVHSALGSNVDPNNLTPAQAQAMVDRYEGPFGIVNATYDGVGGGIHTAGNAVADTVWGWWH